MQTDLSLDLLIVDDHKLVLSGMCSLLSDNPLVNSITAAGTGEEAVALAEQQTFGAVLMDLRLPGINGVEASRQMLAHNPELPIIVLAGKLENDDVRALLAAGVRGYITKGCDAQEMIQAIRTVVHGEQHMSADVAKDFAFDLLNGTPANPFDELTPREREIADELIDGKRNRRIAEQFFISEKTVSTHRTRAFQKLGVSTTAELVRLALRHGVARAD
jgi:two-component system, NarL family, invasion response regulator UvrY